LFQAVYVLCVLCVCVVVWVVCMLCVCCVCVMWKKCVLDVLCMFCGLYNPTVKGHLAYNLRKCY